MNPLQFAKYHALGNDYLVIVPDEAGLPLKKDAIELICHRKYGIGSNGILYGPFYDGNGEIHLRIFNPDGSEAEKSGNGLRIFSRFLRDKGLVSDSPFRILTKGGPVTSRILEGGSLVSIDMGTVRFEKSAIPVLCDDDEAIRQKLNLGGETLVYSAASIGNPHCVILKDSISREEALRIGPLVENHAIFPDRTNVQFLEVVDRKNIKIEIWERGAGYTLASGSSSCAAAAVAKKLGLCDNTIHVHMPGGTIRIELDDAFRVNMTGSVTKVCEGIIDNEMFRFPIHGSSL